MRGRARFVRPPLLRFRDQLPAAAPRQLDRLVKFGQLVGNCPRNSLDIIAVLRLGPNEPAEFSQLLFDPCDGTRVRLQVDLIARQQIPSLAGLRLEHEVLDHESLAPSCESVDQVIGVPVITFRQPNRRHNDCQDAYEARREKQDGGANE